MSSTAEHSVLALVKATQPDRLRYAHALACDAVEAARAHVYETPQVLYVLALGDLTYGIYTVGIATPFALAVTLHRLESVLLDQSSCIIYAVCPDGAAVLLHTGLHVRFRSLGAAPLCIVGALELARFSARASVVDALAAIGCALLETRAPMAASTLIVTRLPHMTEAQVAEALAPWLEQLSRAMVLASTGVYHYAAHALEYTKHTAGVPLANMAHGSMGVTVRRAFFGPFVEGDPGAHVRNVPNWWAYLRREPEDALEGRLPTILNAVGDEVQRMREAVDVDDRVKKMRPAWHMHDDSSSSPPPVTSYDAAARKHEDTIGWDAARESTLRDDLLREFAIKELPPSTNGMGCLRCYIREAEMESVPCECMTVCAPCWALVAPTPWAQYCLRCLQPVQCVKRLEDD